MLPAQFTTTPLTDRFGVIIHGLDLGEVTAERYFAELRALFEEYSALLIRGQDLSADAHMRLATLFGPIEDRKKEERKEGETAEISLVSNVTDEGVTGEMDLHTLNLKANQLWHVDSSFMPTPALCNILTAKVVTQSGGETELASTRAAWTAMPEPLKSRIRAKTLGHNFTRSREKISGDLAKLPTFNKWPPQRWPAVWANPVNGREALYIASHVYEVEGMGKAEGEALIDELMAFCTRPEFVYSHRWSVGDVLIWDQRAVLHRGTPWPYDQPRTLASLCCSMRDEDGVAMARAFTGD